MNQKNDSISYAEAAYNTYTYLIWGEKQSYDYLKSSVSNTASSLLLVLVSQPNLSPPKSVDLKTCSLFNHTISNSEEDQSLRVNLFFKAITSLSDSDRYNQPHGVSFSNLYKFLITGLDNEVNVFLLNLLLSSNSHFCEYCLARTDPEMLVLNTLKETSIVFGLIYSNSHSSENSSRKSVDYKNNVSYPEILQKNYSVYNPIIEPEPLIDPSHKISGDTFSPRLSQSTIVYSPTISSTSNANISDIPSTRKNSSQSKLKDKKNHLIPKLSALLTILAVLSGDEFYVSGMMDIVRISFFLFSFHLAF
ncbi:hypothetical protein AYI68_g853 [Smittium mucronatum]|uniref:Dymeclin n=1 Tax=Smittium mucronatum TaxID=133383 RepID=A0A1R0H7A6_9FUNG|nr:hypothetical protein AYI68_g853 [Smittium mucronatum]